MPNADTQCSVRGERRPKGREEFLSLNFSCLAIKYEFYFTRCRLWVRGRLSHMVWLPSVHIFSLSIGKMKF